jgi:uncharacterized OB-fold protein
MTVRPRDWTVGEPVLLLSTCTRCGNQWYLPHQHCLVCGSGDADQRPARGSGLCVAVTRLHVTAAEESGPVRLCLVELDEGPLVMGRVHDQGLAPGDRASVAFRSDERDRALVPSFGREA